MFFGPKKKKSSRKIGEIAEKLGNIADISAISPKFALNLIKSTIDGGYRVDLHR